MSPESGNRFRDKDMRKNQATIAQIDRGSRSCREPRSVPRRLPKRRPAMWPPSGSHEAMTPVVSGRMINLPSSTAEGQDEQRRGAEPGDRADVVPRRPAGQIILPEGSTPGAV